MQKLHSKGTFGWLDRAGVYLTSACALHCLLLPLWPLLGLALLTDPRVERYALLGSMAIALIAVGFGVCVHHRKVTPVLLMVGGFALYLFKGAMGEAAEPLLLTAGAALIASAHVFNLRCRHAAVSQ